MQEQKSDFLAVLRSPAEHHVEFIVVGGVAAVLQGAPVATFDLEVKVLNLRMVIKTKEEAAHEKDVARLAILRSTLEEKNRR